MRCEDVTLKLEAYLDGDLDSAETAEVQSHLAACEGCQRQLEAEKQWLEAFQDLPAPALSEQRANDLLAGAHARHDARYGGRAPWIGGAIAASLVLGLALGINWPGSGPDPTQPGIAIQDNTTVTPEDVAATDVPLISETVRTVRLAFNAKNAMQGVTLTLELPPNAELEPFPGQQRLSWEVDLDEGENILALPMRVLYPDDGEIIAQLEYGGQRSTFTAPVPHWNERQRNETPETDTDAAM